MDIKTERQPGHLFPIKTSAAFDTYWRFAAERQAVYFKRLKDRTGPWTSDPIIGIHKFTNAYRAADRVSQFLIRNVIYRDDLSPQPDEVFFRLMLFKLFNKIETWKLLEAHLGEISYKKYKFEIYDAILSKAMAEKHRIYSAAYIMPPGGSAFGHKAKHQNHLCLLEMMMRDGVAKKLSKLKRMQPGFELLRNYPTIGDFLAYQFITDVNYSEITDLSEMDFVVPGPGARDGIKKCFIDDAGLNEAEIIRLMADNQEKEFERLGLNFETLFGRRLQLIDCQNLFCEVDQYCRVAHPEIAGLSGRKRIKQKFTPTAEPLVPWFPPKWGINRHIQVPKKATQKVSETSSHKEKLPRPILKLRSK